MTEKRLPARRGSSNSSSAATPPSTDIKAYTSSLSKVLNSAMKSSLPELQDRPDKLRVSGFPFCGLRHLYRLMNETLIGKPVLDFRKNYFCSMGTTAHEGIQRFMGQTGTLLGDWRCYNHECKHVHKLTHAQRCSKCGSEMEYIELEVAFGKYLSGHIDGVWQAHDGKYFVIDYKTSSVEAIKKQAKTPTFPYLTNKAQIKAYCSLVELIFNIKIEGWILIYMARDNPMQTYKCVGELITSREKHRLITKMERYDEHYHIIRTARKFIHIQPLIENKPCKHYDDYLSEYDSIEGCPLSKICFSKDILETRIKNTWVRYRKELKEVQNGKAPASIRHEVLSPESLYRTAEEGTVVAKDKPYVNAGKRGSRFTRSTDCE